MSPLALGLTLLAWSCRVLSAQQVCSAAGTVLAPLQRLQVDAALGNLSSSLHLVPDCHAGSAEVDCEVKPQAKLTFWFTCGQFTGTDKGCNDTYYNSNAEFGYLDENNAEYQLTTFTTTWSDASRQVWQVELKNSRPLHVPSGGIDFGTLSLTWKESSGSPPAGSLIYLHTRIDNLTVWNVHEKNFNCVGDLQGAGIGSSALEVRATSSTTRTTTTTTTTTTMCQWTLKPCGQCLSTPVEYCPANPATAGAKLGPVSGVSLDTPALNVAALERRLAGNVGCVAAASLYPEIGVCNSADNCATFADSHGIMDSGRRINVTIKITNHCMDPSDEGVLAELNNTKVRQMLGSYCKDPHRDCGIDTPGGSIHILPNTIRWHLDARRPFGRDVTELSKNTVGRELVQFQAEVSMHGLNKRGKLVEVSARLPDRSIKISERHTECNQEEGTAWGSSAVRLVPSTSTSTFTTTVSTTSTRTMSSTSTVTTTTRPCACFEMCCEDRPVEGVHLPVHPNVCPEWWQGKMTGRASEANSSGAPTSNMEESLRMKRSKKVGGVSGLWHLVDADTESNSDRQKSFAPTSTQNIFQKWTSPPAGSASHPRPWVAIGLTLTACAALLQAALIIRRSSLRPSYVGVTEQLMQREAALEA